MRFTKVIGKENTFWDNRFNREIVIKNDDDINFLLYYEVDNLEEIGRHLPDYKVIWKYDEEWKPIRLFDGHAPFINIYQGLLMVEGPLGTKPNPIKAREVEEEVMRLREEENLRRIERDKLEEEEKAIINLLLVPGSKAEILKLSEDSITLGIGGHKVVIHAASYREDVDAWLDTYLERV